MAGALSRLHPGHCCGGSLALAGLLDEHGEAIWLDLKRTYGFDLVSFLAGTEAGSPRLILSMIHNLPEGTHYVAALTSAHEEREDINESVEDSEPDPTFENLMWTSDRVLMAQLINAVNTLVRHSIQWETPPKIPIVGPAAWRGEGKKPSQSTSVLDVLNRITGQHG